MQRRDPSRLQRLIDSLDREAELHSQAERGNAAAICARHSRQLRFTLAESGSFSCRGDRPVDVGVEARSCTPPPTSDAEH